MIRNKTIKKNENPQVKSAVPGKKAFETKVQKEKINKAEENF